MKLHVMTGPFMTGKTTWMERLLLACGLPVSSENPALAGVDPADGASGGKRELRMAGNDDASSAAHLLPRVSGVYTPAVFERGGKTAIDAVLLPGCERLRFAERRAGAGPQGGGGQSWADTHADTLLSDAGRGDSGSHAHSSQDRSQLGGASARLQRSGTGQDDARCGGTNAQADSLQDHSLLVDTGQEDASTRSWQDDAGRGSVNSRIDDTRSRLQFAEVNPRAHGPQSNTQRDDAERGSVNSHANLQSDGAGQSSTNTQGDLHRGGTQTHTGEPQLAWDFHADAFARVNRHLVGCADCDLLVVDELGPLELVRGQGFTEALCLLDDAAVPHALVVIRPDLLPLAEARWGTFEQLGPDASVEGFLAALHA